MHDEWFADEEKVRRAVGLLERPVVEYPNAREVSSPYLSESSLWAFCLKVGITTLFIITFF